MSKYEGDGRMVYVVNSIGATILYPDSFISHALRIILILIPLILITYSIKPKFWNEQIQKRFLRKELKSQHKWLFLQIGNVKNMEKRLDNQKKALSKEISKIIGRGDELRRLEAELFQKPVRKNIIHDIGVRNNIGDADLKKFLIMVDSLLERLPDKEIEKFSKSKDFLSYEKVMNKFGK